jgi:predicted  nucleic acid-binding Zn-ribbon protein
MYNTLKTRTFPMEDLNNIRDSIDIMKERITRLEEKMKTVYHRTQRIEDKLDKLIEQGQGQNIDIATNQIQIGNGERMFWLVASAVIGLVMYWLKG